MKALPVQYECHDTDGNLIFKLTTFDENASEFKSDTILTNCNVDEFCEQIKLAVRGLQLEDAK